MTNTTSAIAALFANYSNDAIDGIEKLPQSGSDRVYYRIHTKTKNYIATHSANIKENKTFQYFSQHFSLINCPVPKVLAINEMADIYIQQDFGDTSLLQALEQQGYTDVVYGYFKKSVHALAHMQINGHKGLDYNQCITSKKFGKQAIFSDLLYYKYYFLDTLKIPYDKEKLLEDFDTLSTYLSQVDDTYFMYRDFQSRNIMVQNNEVYFIDFQGGMQGALQYDVASLLWQAKAELSNEWKNNLLEYYITCVEEILQKSIDSAQFISQYNGYVLIRLLQVLGAYGFRGLFERKAHFLTSIPIALKNIQWFLSNKKIGINLPEFEKLLQAMTTTDVIKRFEPTKATKADKLVIHVNSFSFLKNGYPADSSKNGGGFVFDCRGILNPGRIEQYKKLSGKDKPVMEYLEQQTQMPDFLNSIYSIVDISVNDYLKRNFESLMINFGCTGGQHRSVFAAEAIARHLRNKFNVQVTIQHLNSQNWVK